MLDFLTLKPEAFGLDISDLSLKIIKLKKRGRFFSLASFGELRMKPGIIEQGEIRNEEALTENIKKAVNQVKGERLKTKCVIASLPEEKAFLQVIQLPSMKEAEIKKAVYFEAENYIPLSIDKVYLDSQVISQSSGRSKKLDVLIAALPRATVDPYVNSLKKAGLKTLALEIESQAISRALIKNGVSVKPSLLMDLGENRTSLTIFADHSLRFTTTCQTSSQQFTEAIAKSLKIDLKKAEAFKLKYGIKTNKDDKKIFAALNPALTDLTVKTKKYLNYYQAHSAQVEKILLCGGGVNLKGLPEFLSLKLKLPVELGNPWINILAKPEQTVAKLSYAESLRYTTALGLALRGMKS